MCQLVDTSPSYPRDLAGSLTVTTSDSFPGNCSVVEMTFDASYAGSTSVGTVSFHLDGCLNLITTMPVLYTYDGAFTIFTNVGSISGKGIWHPDWFTTRSR
jgi:hypothetical protein